jgi:hypothetical protein
MPATPKYTIYEIKNRTSSNIVSGRLLMSSDNKNQFLIIKNPEDLTPPCHSTTPPHQISQGPLHAGASTLDVNRDDDDRDVGGAVAARPPAPSLLVVVEPSLTGTMTTVVVVESSPCSSIPCNWPFTHMNPISSGESFAQQEKKEEKRSIERAALPGCRFHRRKGVDGK